MATDTDKPAAPEFASWDSYQQFARRVRHERRYVLPGIDRAFLDTVRATIRDRGAEIPAGKVLFRAQQGIDWDTETDDDGDILREEPMGYGAARMKPRPHQAMQGRANPAGIPVLYLGSTEKTAISEVRPWIGASLSVAQFKIMRPIRAINLTLGHGKSSFSEVGFGHLMADVPVSAEKKEAAVWIDIDNAFSRPVMLSDDTADYAPTQILAELFRDCGYDAIAYKSQFDEDGLNLALFNPEDADVLNCAPYEVKSIDVGFAQSGNHWYATKHLPPKTDKH